MAKKPKIPLNPTRAVAYLRVSTDEQHLGPEAQRETVSRFVDLQENLSVVEWFTDKGVSGSVPAVQRPGLSGAIKALAELDAGVLVVAKRDRLARDIMVAASTTRLVEQLGAKILSADGLNDTSVEGDFMRGMIDLMAQHERAVIRRRTRDSLAVKRKKGEKLGGAPPYGYCAVREGKTLMLVENPEEQKVIAEILKLSKDLSAPAIALRLNVSKTPARGSKWHPTTVSRILARD